MLLDSKTADEMQAAIEDVFRRLPEHYRTEIIKDEIAKAVVRTATHGRESYDKVARQTVYAMFSSLDRAIENRTNLASFTR